MANKQMIDAMWDDSPIDVSTEVNFIWSIATNCVDRTAATSTRMSSFL